MKPAVFLDRDGTIIEDKGNLSSPETVRFIPDCIPSLAAIAPDYLFFLVTNQGGVGKGDITLSQVESVNSFIADELSRQGIELTDIYVCPHDKDTPCDCRKPSPMFLHKAARDYNIDLANSYMIGDHPHDIITGQRAGASSIYVLTGHGIRHRSQLGENFPRIVVPALPDAVKVIQAEKSFKNNPAEPISRAAHRLRQGGLVAFPTETVYGLGANSLDPAATAKIFAVKQRPEFDPLIVHLPDISWLSRLTRELPEAARRLAAEFWPGPLTLVLPRQALIPELTVAGLDTVALRMPDHPLTQNLLAQCCLPIAAPSANRFGRISPTTAEHVRGDLGNVVNQILDGGPCQIGVESTIIAFPDDKPYLLRPGGIAIEEIEKITGMPVSKTTTANSKKGTAILAPGMLTKHYSPEKPLSLIPAEQRELPEPPPSGKTGLLLMRQRSDISLKQFSPVEILSKDGNLQEIAANLFAALQRLNKSPAQQIIAELAPDHGLGVAVNDRLQRAAAE